MENPVLLSPDLNNTSRMRLLSKIMKSRSKEEAKGETKSRTKGKRNRLSLLQKEEPHTDANLEKFENLTKVSSEFPDMVKEWGESFDNLISQKAGVEAFTRFLRSEFSEENIEFWMACEDYRKCKDASQLSLKANKIFETFIKEEAPKEVNLDFNTKASTSDSMKHPTRNTFDAAQNKIYTLMEQDSYPRFLRSSLYLDMLHGRPQGFSALRRRSRSFTFNEFKDAQPDFSVWL